MATEDAIILAEKVAASPDDPIKAFKAYENTRYLRTGRTQIMARVYGEFYHARGVAAELRALALGARTPEDNYAGIEWLYGGP
jgi:salicylate hydroxylase